MWVNTMLGLLGYFLFSPQLFHMLPDFALDVIV